MPDLDLIKQAEQEMRVFGKADPALSGGWTKTATSAGNFAADLLRKQQTALALQ
jgi:hypothetical protein